MGSVGRESEKDDLAPASVENFAVVAVLRDVEVVQRSERRYSDNATLDYISGTSISPFISTGIRSNPN